MFDSTKSTAAIALEGPLFGTPLSSRSDNATKVERLLLPIDATERSHLGLAYILKLHQQGKAVEVCLLNVGDTEKNLEVICMHTRQELVQFQEERAQFLLADAAQQLVGQGIAHQAYFCAGNIPGSIAFAADHLDCDAIVLPQPHPAWQRIFHHDNVRDVAAKATRIPVIVVDDHGNPVDTALALAA